MCEGGVTVEWYRQDPGSKPEFIIMLSESSVNKVDSTSHPRASGNVDKDSKEVHLNISSAEVSDSAVYYCALRPTCRPVMMVSGIFLLLSLLIGESVGNTITPLHSSVVISEGESATFSCNYSGNVNNLQWYRQYPNSIPEFLYLMFESGSPTGSVPRLTPSIRKEEKRVFLELSSAEASDSAVYYCALVPTVTGTQTLLCKNLSDVQEEGDPTCPLHRQHIHLYTLTITVILSADRF
ncbi:uncharacterized protein LOC134099405 [Sardina pilchardus]|uniref:uncharacterized protein LOC134099405 n=1 Tax=Sardina pilchardus TaxID=27697 RepID=UPI002E14F246